MSFVNYNILPFEFHQWSHAYSDSLESSYTNIKFTRLKLVLNDVLSVLLGCDEIYHPTLWQPLLEFFQPISNDRFWHDNQVWTVYLFKFS